MKVGSSRSTDVTKLLQRLRRESNGTCRILSTELRSFFEKPTGSEMRGYQPGNFFQISCVAIAAEKPPRRRRRRKNCNPSTNQSNNFGVSRKRFKTSTPGSNLRTDSQCNKKTTAVIWTTKASRRQTGGWISNCVEQWSVCVSGLWLSPVPQTTAGRAVRWRQWPMTSVHSLMM